MKAALIAIVACALASAALADPARPAAKKEATAAEKARPEKARTLIFERGDELEGDRPTAGDGPLVGRSLHRFAGLIRLRTSFRPEIVRSAETL
jgi:hypothetical protein